MQDTLKYLLLLINVGLASVTSLQDSFELSETVGQHRLCIPFDFTFVEMVTAVQVSYQDMDAKGVCMMIE